MWLYFTVPLEGHIRQVLLYNYHEKNDRKWYTTNFQPIQPNICYMYLYVIWWVAVLNQCKQVKFSVATMIWHNLELCEGGQFFVDVEILQGCKNCPFWLLWCFME
jgi:hypothetical protein